MKIVVSVQAKRSSSRGLVHYMATSKTDPVREAEGRALFGEFSDEMSVKSANQMLTNEIGRKRASNEDLHHLVLSLRAEDFLALGESDVKRRRGLREIARVSMKALAGEIGAERLAWAAAIHLNTANPHVHIAIQKDYFGCDGEKRRLTRIPSALLPHHERRGGEGVFNPGKIANAAAEKLEKITVTSPEKSVAFSNEKTRAEAETLAAEMLARHRLEEAHARRDSLEKNGHLLRFKINDSANGIPRFVSLAELERDRLAKLPEKRGIRRLFAGKAEARKPDDSEIRIRTILRRIYTKRCREADECRERHEAVAPIAAAICDDYRRTGRKLPAPALDRDEIAELQSAALNRGDVRAAGYLERVRSDLGLNRSEDELARLKARAIFAAFAARSGAFEIERLADEEYRTRVETGRGFLSISDIEKEIARERKSGGAIRKFARIIGAKSERVSELEFARKEVESGLAARRDEFVAANRLDEKRSAFLSRILAGETNKTSPRFTAAELESIETAARRLRLPEALRENWSAQKEFFRRGHDAETAEKLIGGRAVARRILSDIDAARCRERLDAFRERRQFEKFPVGAGEKRFVSLYDLGYRRNASILDQALELFLEGGEKRSLRREIEKRIALRETGLKDDLARAVEIARDAARESRPFVTDRFLRSPKLATDPIFTSRELAEIEKRIRETPNKTEAKFLTEVLTKSTIREAADREQHPKFYRLG